MTNVSTVGLQMLLINNMSSEKTTLEQLNTQLGTGQEHDNLTDYTASQARQILDLNSQVTQRQSYISSIKNVQSRLGVYDLSMSDMESVAAQASTLASQNQNYDGAKASSILSQLTTMLKQVTDDLNQKVGDRYIYAGTRYSTAPVTDLTKLTDTPSSTTTDTSNYYLPDYDTQYVNSTSTSGAAYAQDQVLVDQGYTVTYGISSNNTSFQQLVAGLRFIQSAVTAGQSGDTATYSSDMTTANNLLTAGLSGIQAIHAGLASNQNILSNEISTQNTDISNLQDQITGITGIDQASVAASLTAMQTQIEASYSATASTEKLSLTQYLG
ncbi:MAG: hypothetical protein JO126_01585 [Alphaproteobacteria bacterium]|nr:hypothetical protein [Alphaproteobacteria bacterium]MBV8548130.1 hypothetical protein [Alphaproteobacteria bacterium]